MGTCQGGICACRASAIMAKRFGNDAALGDLRSFVNERWKGMRPVGWGQTLVEADFAAWIYEGVGGLGAGDVKSNKNDALK